MANIAQNFISSLLQPWKVPLKYRYKTQLDECDGVCAVGGSLKEPPLQRTTSASPSTGGRRKEVFSGESCLPLSGLAVPIALHLDSTGFCELGEEGRVAGEEKGEGFG